MTQKILLWRLSAELSLYDSSLAECWDWKQTLSTWRSGIYKKQTHILYRDIFMLLRRLTFRLHHRYVGKHQWPTSSVTLVQSVVLTSGCLLWWIWLNWWKPVDKRFSKETLEIIRDVSTVGGSTMPSVSKVQSLLKESLSVVEFESLSSCCIHIYSVERPLFLWPFP